MYPRACGEDLSLWRPTRHRLEVRILCFLDGHETLCDKLQPLLRLFRLG